MKCSYFNVHTHGALQKFLLFLRYEELSWEYAEPQDKDNPDCMPCLFLQFPAEENGDDVTKLLQIFSREVGSAISVFRNVLVF